MLKTVLQFSLKILARAMLAKYQPEIIGITGSVGKTSAKVAIAAVLSTKLLTRASSKNYNNELGLPLTIIGADSPGANFFGWLSVFGRAIGLLIWRSADYPRVLVLELAIDRPGDMDYLLSIARPTIGVLTFIGSSHLEFFASPTELQKEKGKLLKNLPKNGWAVVNYDNAAAREAANETKAKIISYGLDEPADVTVQDLKMSVEVAADGHWLVGTHFKIIYQQAVVPVFLAGALGKPAVSAALVATAVGLARGFNLLAISQALNHCQVPAGRFQPLLGAGGSLVIDDSYNAAPQSVAAALETIASLRWNQGAKWLVLGDMLELGRDSQSGHEQAGQLAAAVADHLLVVGSLAKKYLLPAAIAAGLPVANSLALDNAAAVLAYLKPKLKSGDLVLVKASRGIGLDAVVKGLK